jgi:hypothetical protein
MLREEIFMVVIVRLRIVVDTPKEEYNETSPRMVETALLSWTSAGCGLRVPPVLRGTSRKSCISLFWFNLLAALTSWHDGLHEVEEALGIFRRRDGANFVLRTPSIPDVRSKSKPAYPISADSLPTVFKPLQYRPRGKYINNTEVVNRVPW